MTTAAPPERARVEAPPGSRLEQLLAQWGPAKAAAEEAAARFEAVKDAIKAEGAAVSAASAGRVTDVVIAGMPGTPVLSVSWRRAWRLNQVKLKEEQPEIYVRYAEKKGRWECREVTG